MDKSAHGVIAHQAQEPQNYQYNGYCPQHWILLPRCPSSLPRYTGQRVGSPFGIELNLLGGHPVIDAPRSLCVFDEFASI
jgi:hypothetical protein